MYYGYTGDCVSRPYRSARREQAAEVTRRAIVDAARRVFVERGYAGATIAAIADAAEVAVPTVYASVGGKPALLMALQDDMDEHGDVGGGMARIHAETDPAQVVCAAVEVTRRINEQFGDIIAVLDGAVRFEPDAAAAIEEGIRRHRAGWLAVAERLHALGALQAGLGIQAAADTLGILTVFRVWRTLVRDYGWSWSAAADWVTIQAERSVLAHR
jgi:AcrR family transcriptional regulator